MMRKDLSFKKRRNETLYALEYTRIYQQSNNKQVV